MFGNMRARGPVISKLVGVTAVRRHDAVKKELVAASIPAIRTERRDRLIGTVVDITKLIDGGVHWNARVADKPLVIWILDFERCDAWLAALGEWSRLERVEDHELGLLVIGEPSEHAAQSLRTLSRTHISRIDRKMVFSHLGPLLPNTKLLLDTVRVAILVDSRSTGSDCGWSFESQVGYFYGLNQSSSIRPAASISQ